MGEPQKPLVIFGTTQLAEVAHFYFTRDTGLSGRGREVAAFTVDAAYLHESEFLGAPVVAFEEVEKQFPVSEFEMFVAIAYTRLNQARAEKYFAAKAKGYSLATYVSSKLITFAPLAIGDNCLILEDNTIQPFARIGNNTILWCSNMIGHHSRIGDHCFISTHVCVAGGASIGDYCFIGIGSTIRDGVNVANHCLIGAGSLILRDTSPKEVYAPRGDTARKIDVDSIDF